MMNEYEKRISALLVVTAMVLCCVAVMADIDADDGVTIKASVTLNKDGDKAETVTIDIGNDVTLEMPLTALSSTTPEVYKASAEGIKASIVFEAEVGESVSPYEAYDHAKVTLDNGTITVYVCMLVNNGETETAGENVSTGTYKLPTSYTLTMSTSAVELNDVPWGVGVDVQKSGVDWNEQKADDATFAAVPITLSADKVGGMISIAGVDATLVSKVTVDDTDKRSGYEHNTDATIAVSTYASLTVNQGAYIKAEAAEGDRATHAFIGTAYETENQKEAGYGQTLNCAMYANTESGTKYNYYVNIADVPQGQTPTDIVVFGSVTIDQDMTFGTIEMYQYGTEKNVLKLNANVTAKSLTCSQSDNKAQTKTVDVVYGVSNATLTLSSKYTQTTYSENPHGPAAAGDAVIELEETEGTTTTTKYMYCTIAYAIEYAVANNESEVTLQRDAEMSGTVPSGISVVGGGYTITLTDDLLIESGATLKCEKIVEAEKVEANLTVEGILEAGQVTVTELDIACVAKTDKVTISNIDVTTLVVESDVTLSGTANEAFVYATLTVGKDGEGLEVAPEDKEGIVTIEGGSIVATGNLTTDILIVDTPNYIDPGVVVASGNTSTGDAATTTATISGNVTVNTYAIVGPEVTIGKDTMSDMAKIMVQTGSAKTVDKEELCTIYVPEGSGNQLIVNSITYAPANALVKGWMDYATDQPVENDETLASLDGKTIYPVVNYNIYTLRVVFAVGINDVYCNGELMSKETENTAVVTDLVAGTYNITCTVDNTYTGSPTNSWTFEGTDELVKTISLGEVTQNAGSSGAGTGTPSDDGNDGGEGLTLIEILLVILVILIAVMVIIVALRLLRS